MTPKAFRSFALSLPGVHEEPHFERMSFRVGKRIFATMTVDGEEAMVRVGDAELLTSLLSTQAKAFFSYGGWTTRNGSLGVRLSKATRPMIEELLVESWKHSAPRRAVAAFEAESATRESSASPVRVKAARAPQGASSPARGRRPGV
jgi:hypothetical protein